MSNNKGTFSSYFNFMDDSEAPFPIVISEADLSLSYQTCFPDFAAQKMAKHKKILGVNKQLCVGLDSYFGCLS